MLLRTRSSFGRPACPRVQEARRRRLGLGKAVLGVVLAAGWLFAATSAAAFSFTRTSFGTGLATCFGAPRGLNLGLPFIVEGQGSFSSSGLCTPPDSSFGAIADVRPSTAPFLRMGAVATDGSGNGAGVSALIAEGVSFAGVDPTSEAPTLFTWNIGGRFTGVGDNSIAFQVHNDRGGRLANLSLVQQDASSIFFLLQDAAHPAGMMGTITDLRFDFDVSFNLGPRDVGFLAELFADAFLLQGTITSANAFDTAELVNVTPPPGGVVTLASGQTFASQAAPEPTTLGLVGAGLAMASAVVGARRRHDSRPGSSGRSSAWSPGRRMSVAARLTAAQRALGGGLA